CMDDQAVKLARASGAAIAANAGALLLIEVDGTRAGIASASEAIARAARGAGLVELDHADDPDAVAKLWSARRALSPALRNVAPKKINEDVVVPVARLPELVDGLARIAAESGI